MRVFYKKSADYSNHIEVIQFVGTLSKGQEFALDRFGWLESTVDLERNFLLNTIAGTGLADGAEALNDAVTFCEDKGYFELVEESDCGTKYYCFGGEEV